MITSAQKSRIEFHLDIIDLDSLEAVLEGVRLRTLDQHEEATLVGDIDNADPDQLIVFNGSPLCTVNSLLGRCETAFENLSSGTIEESLYVKKAGSVELRKDELKARNRLYKLSVQHLAQLFGINVNKRVGLC